jgi:hypothetical protein
MILHCGPALKGLYRIARSNAPGEKTPLITSLTLPAPIETDGSGEGEGGLNIRDRFNPGALPRAIIFSPFPASPKLCGGEQG